MSDTRTSKEFSITIRPGEAHGIEPYRKDFLDWIDLKATHYVIGVEQKGDLSTQHFQVAVIFDEEKRSDNLKASLVELLGDQWNPAQKRNAICVKKNRKDNDIRILAGGYCCKQDTTPYIKGWSEEELEPFATTYTELKSKSEMRNLSRENITTILKESYNEIAYHKCPELREKFEIAPYREQLNLLYKYTIAKGYDLQKYSVPNWFNYYLTNYDVLFVGRTADGLLEFYSGTPI